MLKVRLIREEQDLDAQAWLFHMIQGCKKQNENLRDKIK